MASEIAKTPEELNALSTIVQVQTYGGRFGTYQGFNRYSFKDATVKEKCSEAFRENPSRSNAQYMVCSHHKSYKLKRMLNWLYTIYIVVQRQILDNMSSNKELKEGQEITINIPFTYTIGEEGFNSGKILKTIQDCKDEVLAEIENGNLNHGEIFMEVSE